MENKDKIYEQFKDAAEKAEQKGFDRMEAVWNRVEDKLDEKKKRRGVVWWKYTGAAALLLIFISIGNMVIRNNPDPIITPDVLPDNSVTVIDTQKVNETFNPEHENITEEVVVNDEINNPITQDENNAVNNTPDKEVKKINRNTEKTIREEVVTTSAKIQKPKIETATIAHLNTVQSDSITITGIVEDELGRLPGANIFVKGTQIATQSNIDGEYTIKAKKGDILEFSFVGFQNESIAVSNTDTLNIKLNQSILALDAVVVTDKYRNVPAKNKAVTTNNGNDYNYYSNSATVNPNASNQYGAVTANRYPVEKDTKTAAAMTTVSVEEVEDRANANIIQNLQGQVAGLNIATGSGQPGADSTIVLRGVGSINGNVEPLFVVDGIPVDEDSFRSLSPNDIASFSILKDAAATSIYGNRGANGVIVIKTKKGLSKKELRKLKRKWKEQEKKRKKAQKNNSHTSNEQVPFHKAEPQGKIQIDQEEYESFEENQFENPAIAPLSTFSIDVDNASYTNIRRFINNGQTVPKDAVRVEEMVNFFNYQYPQPTDNKPFSINTEYSDAPWNSKHKLLKIGLKGVEIPTADLPASNFVFLIDVSGSMDFQNKLPLLKESMKILVKQMRSNDRIAIVVYAGAAGLVLPSTSGAEKDKIIAALDDLDAGGSTAGGEGINLAYKIAQENFIKKGNNRVILATDGDFNVGPSSNDDMQTLIEQKRKSGVFLTCLGYGMGNYKDSKMEILADKGNGNYAYIDNMQEADRFLQKEFKGSMYAIAKDVKIQIEFNPKHVQSYRLIGYENRKLRDEDFANDAIDAGELGSGHTVTALYEIIPTGVESDYFTPAPELKYSQPNTLANEYGDELATIKLRYKKPDEDVSKETVKVIPNVTTTLSNTSGDFKFAAAVAWFGLKLRDSKLIPNKTSQDIINLAKQGAYNDPDGYRAEFIRLVNRVE